MKKRKAIKPNATETIIIGFKMGKKKIKVSRLNGSKHSPI
jgi:hypothetical protein